MAGPGLKQAPSETGGSASEKIQGFFKKRTGCFSAAAGFISPMWLKKIRPLFQSGQNISVNEVSGKSVSTRAVNGARPPASPSRLTSGTSSPARRPSSDSARDGR